MKNAIILLILLQFTHVAIGQEQDKAKTFTYDPKLDLYEADKEVVTQLGDNLGMKLMLIDQEEGEPMPLHAHPPYHSYYFYEGEKGEAQFGDIIWGKVDLPVPFGGIEGPASTAPHSGPINTSQTHIKCIDLDIYNRSEMGTSKLFEYDPKKDLYNLKSAAVKQLSDTLGIKMYLLILKPNDSIALNQFNHPKHAVFVMEGGRIERSPSHPSLKNVESFYKTEMGAIRNATKFRETKDKYYIKNIDDHDIKLWFTDVYPEE